MKMYLIHRKAYLEYKQSQKTVQRILNEREVLFQKTQPRSPSYADKVQGGTKVNKTEEYVIDLERRRIKERLTEAEEIMKERQMLLELYETELRKSKNLYDVVYTARWIDGKKPEAIADETFYSRSHIYNIIKRISTQIERI